MRMSANLTVVRTLLSNTGDVSQADVWLSAVRADHPQKLYQLPDEHLPDAMPVAKKITLAVSAVDYTVLQARVVHAAGWAVAPYCL